MPRGRIVGMWLDGATQREIGEAVGLTQNQVSIELRRWARDRWRLPGVKYVRMSHRTRRLYRQRLGLDT